MKPYEARLSEEAIETIKKLTVQIESLQAQLAEAKECQALADDILKSKNEIVGTLEYELDEIKQERDKLQWLVRAKDSALDSIMNSVSGFVDGAPDAGAFSKTSNYVYGDCEKALALTPDSLPPLYTEEQVRPLVEAADRINWWVDRDYLNNDAEGATIKLDFYVKDLRALKSALSTFQRKERDE